jgi:hypothetical protein
MPNKEIPIFGSYGLQLEAMALFLRKLAGRQAIAIAYSYAFRSLSPCKGMLSEKTTSAHTKARETENLTAAFYAAVFGGPENGAAGNWECGAGIDTRSN